MKGLSKSRLIMSLAMMSVLMSDPYYSERTVTTPKYPTTNKHNLPLWRVGKHKVFAKNENDALKYAKKRGLWDGISKPVLIK